MIDCEAVVFQQNTNLADMDVLSISPIFQQYLADIPKVMPQTLQRLRRVVVFVVKICWSKEDQCEPFLIIG